MSPRWMRAEGCVVLLVVLVLGCGSATPTVGKQPPKGMHDGLLVSWGQEGVAAEFTIAHERQQAVVYTVDGEGKNAAPIAAQQLVLVLRRPAVKVFLQAQPQEGDPAGSASRFVGRMPVQTRGRKFAGTLRARLGGKECIGEFDQQQDFALRAER
jgi:hypothetical protein